MLVGRFHSGRDRPAAVGRTERSIRQWRSVPAWRGMGGTRRLRPRRQPGIRRQSGSSLRAAGNRLLAGHCNTASTPQTNRKSSTVKCVRWDRYSTVEADHDVARIGPAGADAVVAQEADTAGRPPAVAPATARPRRQQRLDQLPQGGQVIAHYPRPTTHPPSNGRIVTSDTLDKLTRPRSSDPRGELSSHVGESRMVRIVSRARLVAAFCLIASTTAGTASASPQGDPVRTFRNPSTNRCLDYNRPDGVRSYPCNGGAWQQ